MIGLVRRFLKQPLPEDSSKFLNGLGNWAVPSVSGGGAWTFIGTSAPVAGSNVDFTNLSGYNEILAICRLITADASAIRYLSVSTDNGGTFLTSSGDYINVDVSGVEANDVSIAFHGTPTASARTGWIIISNFNVATYPKTAFAPIRAASVNSCIIPTTSALNAVRFRLSAGTFTGGNLYLFGR